MHRRLHSTLLIPLLFLSIFNFEKKDISISAESAILMSTWAKRIIYSKNSDLKLAPASTTKIMTALVVLKNSSLDKEVIVSKFATSMEPSKIYIKEGEVYSTFDLLKALLLNSGNDASVALAESIAGSEEKFVKMMNEMARSIGAKDTNFKTSNGLPAKGQYSTARDLALIVREAMRHKELVEIIKMKKGEIIELKSNRRIKLKSHNKSLWKNTPYAILGKTGYTKKAGSCFAGYIEYNRWRKVIVVILKSKAKWKDLDTLAEEFL
ncbi:MAG: D-alanyl-D-alanine carboxypeptidase [Candidatus Omnitrophica bacterium]|nr:D-alanyl-D-alanine carboxypeptidase [Candidatus Omnitrophota bacterium]